MVVCTRKTLEWIMSGKTILVVEDNPINLRLVEVLLKAEGYQVLIAKDGEEALNSVQNTRPDLILTDLQLPGMDGLELTRRLKADAATGDIYVIALTAYSMLEDEQHARQAGCDDYITKPISPRILLAKISEYLAGTRNS
jgi:two-component system cell cycle response regulator DivK